MHRLLVLFLLISGLSGHRVFAQDIRILSPYVGVLYNKEEPSHEGNTIVLSDAARMEGLFFQWIRPGAFQANAFLYHASNINYSTVWGGHMMGDAYFHGSRWGAFLLGGGSEFISINMDADSNRMPVKGGGYTGFSDFEMRNTIVTPFLRTGYRFTPLSGRVKLAMTPWTGVQYEGVRGAIEVDFPAFQYPAHAGIRSNDWYALLGLGLNATLFHFIDLEVKYHATFNAASLYSTASAMTNIFLTRHIGLSYRYKYMEMYQGSNIFNMGSVVFVL